MSEGRLRGKDERLAVPAMPMPMAVVCCILNFLIPGLGTMLAGFSPFCCARNEDMSGSSRFASCCISFGIGLLQLVLVVVLLLGWVWSCLWGIFFIGMSAEYYHDNQPNRAATNTVYPGPTIIVTHQPGYRSPQPPPPYSEVPGPSAPPMYPGGLYDNPPSEGLYDNPPSEPPPPYPGTPKY